MRTHPKLTRSWEHTSWRTCYVWVTLQWAGPAESMSSSPRFPYISPSPTCPPPRGCVGKRPQSPSSLWPLLPSCFCLFTTDLFPRALVLQVTYVAAASLSSATGRGVWDSVRRIFVQVKRGGAVCLSVCVCVCLRVFACMCTCWKGLQQQQSAWETRDAQEAWEHYTWKTTGGVCWTGWPNTHSPAIYKDKHTLVHASAQHALP